MPAGETLSRLAEGLGVPEHLVRLAASLAVTGNANGSDELLACTDQRTSATTMPPLKGFAEGSLLAEVQSRIDKRRNDADAAKYLTTLHSLFVETAVSMIELPQTPETTARAAINAVEPLYNHILKYFEMLQNGNPDAYREDLDHLTQQYSKLLQAHSQRQASRKPPLTSGVSDGSGPVVFYEYPYTYPRGSQLIRMPEAPVITSPQFPEFRFQARNFAPTPTEVGMLDKFLGAKHHERLNVTQIRCTGPRESDPVYLIRHPQNDITQPEFGMQLAAVWAVIEYWVAHPEKAPKHRLPTGEYVIIMLRGDDRMGWVNHQLAAGEGARLWPYFTRDGERPFFQFWREHHTGPAPYLIDGKPCDITDDTPFSQAVDLFYDHVVSTVPAAIASAELIADTIFTDHLSEELFTASHSLPA